MGLYNEEHKLFQQSIAKFAEKEILPHVNRWEEEHDFPSAIFKTLGSAGYLGILIDETQGGVGGDYTLAAAWCEEFGRIPSVGFTTGVNMHSLIITPTLARLGSSEAKEKFLQRAITGEAIGAYAFTEPGAGSDLSQIRTQAVREGASFRINGAKTFITNGRRADYILTLAKTAPDKGYDGFTTFVIDTTAPGFKVTRTLSKLGWHASDTAELSFTDLLVPESMVLGNVGQGWHQAMSSLGWERLMLTLSAIGGARACLESTIRYVNDRKVFGRTVGSFDSNREMLVSLTSRLEAARALAHRCITMLNNNMRCRKEISFAKIVACELAIEIADRCLQLHGGYGYTTEYLPERWLRDLRLNTIGGGTTQVMARIAVRELTGV